MLTAKKRKDITNKDQEVPPIGGYWYPLEQGRRQGKPLKGGLARRLDWQIGQSTLETRLSEGEFPTLAIGLASYYGESSPRVERLAKSLFADLYCNPQGLIDIIMENQSYAEKYSADMFAAMYEVGKLNIFFDDARVDTEFIVGADNIAENLYVTRKRVGIPIKEFLILFKGAELKKADLSALSGIPAKYIQWVYDTITAYMWRLLKERRRKEDVEKSTQKQALKTAPIDEFEFEPLVFARVDIKPVPPPTNIGLKKPEIPSKKNRSKKKED